MRIDYHKPTLIYDFFVGRSRSNKIMVKRYTYIEDPHMANNGYYSDNPLYEFPVETIGLDGLPQEVTSGDDETGLHEGIPAATR